RDALRQSIGSEGMWRVTIDVARNLIEQQHKREGAVRIQFPSGKFTARRRMMRFLERAAAAIEGLVLREPGLWAGVAPEANDLRCIRHALCRAMTTLPANIITNSTVPMTTSSDPRIANITLRSPLWIAMKMPGAITNGPMTAKRHWTGASRAVAKSG